jgi:TatD DNase family protein
MIDSHCHIDLEVFDHDRDEVIKDAFDAGIKRMLVLGLHNQQFASLLSLKQKYRQIDIALGLHPYFLNALTESQTQIMLRDFEHLAHLYSNDYVALGEMGLDSSLNLSMEYQQTILRFQLDVAKQLNKPIVLHHRKSHNSLIRILKQERYQGRGILHAFSGSYQDAMTYIDMGFVLGIGGTITYPRARKTRDTVAKLPLTSLVIETDSPDMPLNGFQGQRNQPSQLCLVAAALAELKKVELCDIEQQTSINYSTLFGLSL